MNNPEDATQRSLRQCLSRIFYRPSEVFATQKVKRTWVSIVCLLFVMSFVETRVVNFSSSYYMSINLENISDGSDSSKGTGSSDSSSALRLDSKLSGDTDVLTSYGEQRPGTSIGFIYRVRPEIYIAVIVLFVLLVQLLFHAFYFRIVSGLFRLELKLDHWLALVAWSHMPAYVFSVAATIVLSVLLYVLGDLLGHKSIVLARLLGVDDISNGTASFFLNYSVLAEVWIIALQTIGIRDWTGRSTHVSFVIAVVPFVLICAFLWSLLA